MKQTPQDNAMWWNRFLSKKNNTTSTSYQSPQAKILQSVLIWFIIATILYSLVVVFVYNETPVNALWYLIFYVSLYAMSRTRFYPVISLGFVLLLVAQPYMARWVDIYHNNPSMPYMISIFAIPVTIVLFSGMIRKILIVLVASFVVVTLIFGGLDQTLTTEMSLIMTMFAIGIPIFYTSVVTSYDTSTSPDPPYLEIVNRSPDLVSLIVQGNVVFINPAGLELLRLSSEDDVLGKSLDAMILKSEYEISDTNKYMTRSNRTGEMVVESVETIKRSDGSTFRAWMTRMPFDMGGTFARLVIIKAMPQFISQPDSILESADVLISVQRDGKLLYINSYFERLTGFSRQEVYSSNYHHMQFTHVDDQEKVRRWMQDTLNGVSNGEPIEYRMYHKNHSEIWVRTSCNVIRYAGETALLTTTLDITPQQMNKMALLAQDAVPYPWLMIKRSDEKPIIVAYHSGNQSWFDDKVLVGSNLYDLIIDLPDDILSILDLTTQYQKPYQQRHCLQLGRGKTLPIEWAASPIEDNHLADYLIVLRDTSDELLLEDELLRYRAMFNMMNDYAFLLKVLPHKRFEYVWVNNAFEIITGYNPRVDDTNDILKRLPYKDDASIITQHFDQLLRGEMSVIEYRIITKSGQVRWIREHAYPVVEDQRITLIYGSVSDITEFVKSEETLKNITLQQAVIAEIGMVAANANLDIPSFANQILNLVTQLITVSWCVLMEYHPEKDLFTVHSMVGEGVSGPVECRPTDKRSYLGYVLHQNDPVLVRDWSKETRFESPAAYRELGIQTSLSVVVPMQDRQFGILNVHDIYPRNFSSEHINLLQTIANLIGTYVQQRETQVAEREHRMMAEALINVATSLNSTTELEDILTQILEFVSQIVPVVDSANLMLVDRAEEVAKITIRHTVNPNVPDAPPGRDIPFKEIPLFLKMIATGETLVLNDVTEVAEWYSAPETKWVRSYLGAPIFAGDECIGVVSLDSAQANAFTQEHVQQMQAFLNQASIAIQNARHAEKLAQEIKNATQQLQSERIQLQAILDATGEGIFYSRNFEMLYTNKALSDIMGYAQEELLGKSSFIFRPDDMTEEEIENRDKTNAILRQSGVVRTEIRFKRKDGSTFMGGVTASCIRIVDDVLEAVTVVRDISREKQIEAQKETFISNASHELRGPITTLNTRMYVMKHKEQIEKEDVEKMDVVVQKMNALVSGLLDLSRFESGRIQLNLQAIILQTIVHDVMEYQLPEAEKRQQSLHAVMPDEPMNMVGDSLRLNQVLTNLISNSINYTPEGGQIDVIIGYSDSTEQTIKIEVVDDGIGIDNDSLKTIFMPFSQAHNNNSEKGTGLGLSISKQIVEAHGGHIDVESVEGEGSRFIVYLPTVATRSEDS